MKIEISLLDNETLSCDGCGGMFGDSGMTMYGILAETLDRVGDAYLDEILCGDCARDRA